jgi:hypothetical protein
MTLTKIKYSAHFNKIFNFIEFLNIYFLKILKLTGYYSILSLDNNRKKFKKPHPATNIVQNRN